MLSPKLRREVFNLWSLFWSSGMTNPLTAIEQITFLLFLKQLEALDRARVERGRRSIYAPRGQCELEHHSDDRAGDAAGCRGHETCRWSYITANPSHDLFTRYVFPWLREIDEIFAETGNGGGESREEGYQRVSRQMDDAYFQFPKSKENSLQRAVQMIDALFQSARSANADLMGDIFEYLLSEIQTSGKNGQFRTPRHIIRLMVDLLDPQPGERIIDPAAGTGGFLINSIQHLLQAHTDPETVVLEWDGTPHRIIGESLDEAYLNGRFFTGYDNDRTMVRIGWMNMILHGVEAPIYERRDPLGKSLSDNESGFYQIVLANPPFRGSVDKGDLHESRFPPNPSKSGDPITTRSELLFVWLMLDLLARGGRCAVIVPEGVLFGSTTAHKELRRALIFDNRLEGVISLPNNIFLPYAGVKTSILIFQKYGDLPVDSQPRTDQVWFYEVEADGYTLDAKREEKAEPNDLWDLLEKWPNKNKGVDDDAYYQPRIYEERWVLVDEQTMAIFPDVPEVRYAQGQERNLAELFGIPAAPDAATAQVSAEGSEALAALYDRLLDEAQATAQVAYASANGAESSRQKAAQTLLEQQLNFLNRLLRERSREMLDTEFDQFGRKALEPVQSAAEQAARARLSALVEALPQSRADEAGDESESESATPPPTDYNEFKQAYQPAVDGVVRGFARLDGYNVKLRTAEVTRQEGAPPKARSWTAPVRRFVEEPTWSGVDGDGAALAGSHTPEGSLRPAYLRHLREEREIFDTDGTVKSAFSHLLDPECIEAHDLNLSARTYKLSSLAAVDYDPPAQIIAELQALEERIQVGLEGLLAMVEGVA